MPVEGNGCWGWSVRGGRVGMDTHVRPPTSEGHKFFVQTPFQVFLNSMERPFCQDCIHVMWRALGVDKHAENLCFAPSM